MGIKTKGEHMKIEKVSDYAYPCMMVEKKIKLVHELMLQNKYDDALAEATLSITYVADMMQAIKEMKVKSKNNA
jgi:hypothetical protein